MDKETTVLFSKPAYSLSWAPLGGGFPKKMRAVINLTCDANASYESILDQAKRARERVADSLVVKPKEIAVMITAVPQIAGSESRFRHEKTGLEVRVFCTAGLGNAVSVGEPPTYDEESAFKTTAGPGTVNVIIAVNRTLTRPAILEAASSAVIGKATAIAAMKIVSSDGTPKLATGTDCVTVSAIAEQSLPPLRFAGLHTVLGQAIASTVQDACLSCLKKKKAP